MHDARIFRNSSLSAAIRVRLAGTPYHILADTAYPLIERIMVPYRRNRELEPHEEEFNAILKSERQDVERAIGLIKMKWRRLKYLDVFKLKNAHTILMVAICLHNFGLAQDGWIDDAPFIHEEEEEEDEYLHVDHENDNFEEMRTGIEKKMTNRRKFDMNSACTNLINEKTLRIL
jgi:hypothetical protein